MDDLNEYIGYFASAVLLVSFTMKKMTTLRIINTIGCGFFILYGLLIGSFPVIITNVAICLINLYYLLIKDRVKS
ncbi:MAG: uroporphyrinogen decarboxylase [Crocinitomicaceae bacterium]